jgi:hypothetical protein
MNMLNLSLIVVCNYHINPRISLIVSPLSSIFYICIVEDRMHFLYLLLNLNLYFDL